jgi:hypothetical protein
MDGKTQIICAIIGVAGVLGAALITSGSFNKSGSTTQTNSPSATVSARAFSELAESEGIPLRGQIMIHSKGW